MLSFRGIIAYYYYSFHVHKTSLLFSEIESIVNLHAKVGKRNPLFIYDPESFIWFVDFSRIGKDLIPVTYVLETIVEILYSLNLYENVKCISPLKIYNKFKDAILEFDKTRTRPQQTILIPTFFNCGIPFHEKSVTVNMLKNFTQSHFADKNKYSRYNYYD